MSPALAGGFLSAVSSGNSGFRLFKLSAGQKYLSNEKGLEGIASVKVAGRKNRSAVEGLRSQEWEGDREAQEQEEGKSLPSSPEVTLCLADAKETMGSVTTGKASPAHIPTAAAKYVGLLVGWEGVLKKWTEKSTCPSPVYCF